MKQTEHASALLKTTFHNHVNAILSFFREMCMHIFSANSDANA